MLVPAMKRLLRQLYLLDGPKRVRIGGAPHSTFASWTWPSICWEAGTRNHKQQRLLSNFFKKIIHGISKNLLFSDSR